MNLANLVKTLKEVPASLREAPLLLTVIKNAKVTGIVGGLFGIGVFLRRDFSPPPQESR